MRTRTAGENTLLAAAHKRLAYKVEIQDEAAAWQDMGALSGRDWVISIEGNESIDEPIQTLTVELRRDHDGGSLSPFRGDSSLNVGGAAIDVGRGIRVSVAYATFNTAPAGGDFQFVHVGTIDSIDFSQPNIVIQARMAVGATLVDSWVREETTYGTVGGELLDVAIQNVIDDWAPGITLDVPSAPAYALNEDDWPAASVWDTIRAMAGLIGWDVRILWNDTEEEFRPTLIEPDRSATVPAWTLGPEDILSVDQLSIDRTWVRNFIRVTYVDAAGEPQSEDASDATSIARFGELWAEIIRGDGSPINTSGEAQDLADAALADLAWPVADQVVQVPLFWPLEVGDLLRFSANDIHYDEDQDLAATAHRWRIGKKTARSWISVRGKPAGFYLNWLRGGGVISDEIVMPTLAAGDDVEDHGTLSAISKVLVHDPSDFATRLLYKKRVVGQEWPAAWSVKSLSPANGDEFTESVTLVEGHSVQVMWGLEYNIPGVSSPLLLPIFPYTSPSYDLGYIPNVVQLEVDFADDGEALVYATADFDARSNGVNDSIIFTVAEDIDPAAPTTGTNDGSMQVRDGQTVASGVTIAPGSSAHVLAAAIDSAGNVGPVFGPRVKRRAGALEVPTVADLSIAYNTNGTACGGSAGTLTYTYAVNLPPGHTVTLELYGTNNGVTTLVSTPLSASSSATASAVSFNRGGWKDATSGVLINYQVKLVIKDGASVVVASQWSNSIGINTETICW